MATKIGTKRPDLVKRNKSLKQREAVSLSWQDATIRELRVDKISKSALGNKAWLGKKHSDFTKEKISRINKGRVSFSGENHPRWKGGVSSLNHLIRGSAKYLDWRKSVFQRDNYVCASCKSRNGNGKTIWLEAHHIKKFQDYPELRYEINNGITLCKECHRQTKGNEKIFEVGFTKIIEAQLP